MGRYIYPVFVALVAVVLVTFGLLNFYAFVATGSPWCLALAVLLFGEAATIGWLFLRDD